MDYVAIEDIRALAVKLNAEPGYQHEDEDFYVGVSTLASEIEELQRMPEKKGYWKAHQMQRWIYAKCSECGTVLVAREEIDRLGGIFLGTYVAYDGSKNKECDVHSLYRYYDYHDVLGRPLKKEEQE